MLRWFNRNVLGGNPLLALLVVCSIAGSGVLPIAAEEVDLTRFERTTVVGGLTQPMEFEVAPDGQIYLIELAGKLKRIDPQSGDVEQIGQLAVTTEQENGLIGLALDPDFSENGWIYLQYSPPDFVGQHVSRFDIRDGQLDLASEKLLFSYPEQRRECCHHAGSLEFGPHGDLYIGTGDNTNPFNDSQGYAPIDERPGREPWDAQRSSGNTKSYNGKVLRIHPEADGTYSIPDGNLFPKDGSIGYPEIFVMGCRNPWRISVDQRTGYLYWGDVGPDAGGDGKRGPRGYDEINQARAAGNFGWPYFIGDNYAYPLVDFASGEIHPPQDPLQPRNRSVNNTGAELLPPAQPAMIFYPAAGSERFPEVGSGGRTACAGPVYYFDSQSTSDRKFPAAYNRTLFAFEWSRNRILAVHLDEDSRVERLERFLPDQQFTRPIDLQFDAHGALYVLEYGETWGVNPDSQLVRIDYVRGNRAPIAVAQASHSVGREPLLVQFAAEGSFDKDNDPLSFRWTAIRATNGQPERQVLGSQPTLQHRFETPGVVTMELEVSDPAGARGVTSLPVIVGNARPEIRFVEPQDGDFFVPGEEVPYRVVVRDQEDGTSDFEEADTGDWHLIEATAPSRVFVEAAPAPTDDAATAAPGLAFIRKSDCFNCHAVTRSLVGPSFLQIADKYRDQPHQLEQSVQRVMQGSTGVWGKVAMLPHSQHTAAQVRQMVEYVFSIQANQTNPTANGFNNRLEVPPDWSTVRLQATYTDLGRDELPKLSGSSTIVLRSRRLQAEAADEFHGTQVLSGDSAEGKQFMGAIEHLGYLKWNRIQLDHVRRLTVRVASAGAGGRIEIHRDAVDGPVLGSVQVEVNGDWNAFYEKTFEVEQADGRHDLFVVFKNETNRGGLMNLDAIHVHDR